MLERFKHLQIPPRTLPPAPAHVPTPGGGKKPGWAVGKEPTPEVMLDEDDEVPRAHPTGTALALVALLLTAVTLSGNLPSELGRYAGYGAGIGLGLSLALDLTKGVRNIIRADVMALLAFYFLTLVEYFFPQANFNAMISPELVRPGIHAVFLGFAGLYIGRHLWHPKTPPLLQVRTYQVPASFLIGIFWASFFVGYAHMLLAVNFNVVEMVQYMMDARFSQPWGRGKFGDWKALFVELGLFIYLIPPLSGIILARAGRYSMGQLVPVVVALLFTLFYGFSSGTRNIFAAYLVTFLIGYSFALPRHRRKEALVLSVGCAVLMGAATPIMLAFRNEGLMTWLKGETTPRPPDEEKTLFVDYNLYAICMIMQAIPQKIGYLGLEIPYNALIRPIPRAIWPGKPEGLSYSIEDALGVEGLTISATFVGEAWMSAGYFGVIVSALLFGSLLGWWSHLSSLHNSELGILIYSSGFFSSVITMRSLFTTTTALLPTFAAIMIGSITVSHLMKLHEQKLRMGGGGGGAGPQPNQPPTRRR